MMLSFVRRLMPHGGLAQNTILAGSWQFARIASQALATILIARMLGPSAYGTFAGIAGLATAIGGLTGIGSGWLLLQSVSRDASTFSSRWRQAIVLTSATGTGFALAFGLIAHALAGEHASLPTLMAIGFAELLFYPVILVTSFAFQAHEKLGWSNAMPALLTVFRLSAAILFFLLNSTPDVDAYARWHLGASVLAATVAMVLTIRALRPLPATLRFTLSDFRDGLSFSSMWVSSNTVTEFDKTLALRLAGGEIAGLYASAYRFASMLTLPTSSLILAAQPRLFRAAQEPESSDALIRRLVGSACANSLAAGIVLYFAAGLLPMLLGPSFAGAPEAARLMALWPLAYSTRLLAGTLLMTRGRKMPRIALELIAVVLMTLLAIVLVPTYGLRGVVATTLATEATLSICLWLLVAKTRNLKPAPLLR